MTDSRRRSQRGWRIRLGGLPNYIVAAVCAICATVIWPSQLSWGLLGLGALAILAAWISFDFGFEEPSTTTVTRRRVRPSQPSGEGRRS